EQMLAEPEPVLHDAIDGLEAERRQRHHGVQQADVAVGHARLDLEPTAEEREGELPDGEVEEEQAAEVPEGRVAQRVPATMSIGSDTDCGGGAAPHASSPCGVRISVEAGAGRVAGAGVPHCGVPSAA